MKIISLSNWIEVTILKLNYVILKEPKKIKINAGLISAYSDYDEGSLITYQKTKLVISERIESYFIFDNSQPKFH